MQINDNFIKIFLIGWILILGFMTCAVISAEYYTAHIYEYNDGGQIVNVTMLEGEYVYIYTDGEGYGTGRTEHKIVIGDMFIRYNVKDGIDIPIFYSPREWQEILRNNDIIETTEYYLPKNLLISLYVIQALLIVVGSLIYVKKKRE